MVSSSSFILKKKCVPINTRVEQENNLLPSPSTKICMAHHEMTKAEHTKYIWTIQRTWVSSRMRPLPFLIDLLGEPFFYLGCRKLVRMKNKNKNEIHNFSWTHQTTDVAGKIGWSWKIIPFPPGRWTLHRWFQLGLSLVAELPYRKKKLWEKMKEKKHLNKPYTETYHVQTNTQIYI